MNTLKESRPTNYKWYNKYFNIFKYGSAYTGAIFVLSRERVPAEALAEEGVEGF
jgi:hypothetical protein